MEKSILTCVALSLLLLVIRLVYTPLVQDKPLMVTDWDAFGYYMYAPSMIIYQDVTELEWRRWTRSTTSPEANSTRPQRLRMEIV